MEIDKGDKSKEDYIHSLVKHLTCTNEAGAGVGVVNKNDDSNMQQPPKKQVRRRLHTNKPYKERLMNMAEARREIATALKFHRASMKQQKEGELLQTHRSSEQQEMSNGKMYPYTTTNNYSGLSLSHHWPISTIVPPLPSLGHHENLNLVLPNQTLGLNLNFQDFNNLNTSIYHTPSSPAAKTIEIGAEEDRNAAFHQDDDGYHHPFEQVMEFPPWLTNANESSCLQDLFQYSTDPALPCMDIGEIEGMDDEEWLA